MSTINTLTILIVAINLKKKLAWHESIVYMSVFDRCDTIRVNKKTLGPTYSLVQLNVCTDRSGNVISV